MSIDLGGREEYLNKISENTELMSMGIGANRLLVGSRLWARLWLQGCRKQLIASPLSASNIKKPGQRRAVPSQVRTPRRWRGHLANLPPKPSKVAKVEHHAAMSFDDLPAFMSELQAATGLTSRALEFTILTAARTTEALGAQWSEFDLETGIWTVTAVRMKAGKAHRVPLSPRAVEIVKELETVKRNEFVFPGEKPDRHLSNMGKPVSQEAIGEGIDDTTTAHQTD